MEVLKLDEKQMFNISLRAVDDIFADEETKDTVRSKFFNWKSQHLDS